MCAGCKWELLTNKPPPVATTRYSSKKIINITVTYTGFSSEFEFLENVHFKGVLAIYSGFAINSQISTKFNETPLK